MKKLALIISSVSLLFFSACEDDKCLIGSGQVESYTLNVDDFHGVALSGPVNLRIKQGSVQKVEVAAEPEMYRELTYKVKNNALEIGIEGNVTCFETNFGVWVNVTVPDINQISISGESEVVSDGDLNLEKLDISISGIGKITLSGNVNQQHINLSGDMIVKDFDLKVNDLSLNISGSADMEINCQETLDIDLSGSATINYKGSPEITQIVSGSLILNDEN